MRLKRHFNFVLVLVSMATVLLPSGLRSQSVHAGGGVVFRPPFSGAYRVTAYFDHQNPNHVGIIWPDSGQPLAAVVLERTDGTIMMCQVTGLVHLQQGQGSPPNIHQMWRTTKGISPVYSGVDFASLLPKTVQLSM